MQARIEKPVTTNIIIYPPFVNDIHEKIKHLVNNTDIEVMDFKELTTYQKERAFIYGNSAYGHATAVICISGEEPIPFGVISADINNKKLPVIVYVENNDKARKIYADYYHFLEETNTQISKLLQNVDSFHFKSANHVVLYEKESEGENRFQLIEAVKQKHAIYLQQPEKMRTVRMESVPPTKDQLDEKRSFFSKKEGFSRMPTSLEEFKSHLANNRPTVSFFGMIFAPITDKCEWATELGDCNLIFGLGGAEKNKSLKQQSVMYQFAHYAKLGGSQIYGTIPFDQASWQEKMDFSIGIESCYITPQLQERMDVFKKLSDLIIVGSTGTGTYEEILDTLRTNPQAHIIIINDDGGNTPLVRFLDKNKDNYANVTVANTRAEFKVAVENFKNIINKLNLKNNSNSLAFFSPVLEDAKTESLKPQQSTRTMGI